MLFHDVCVHTLLEVCPISKVCEQVLHCLVNLESQTMALPPSPSSVLPQMHSPLTLISVDSLAVVAINPPRRPLRARLHNLIRCRPYSPSAAQDGSGSSMHAVVLSATYCVVVALHPTSVKMA
jgi:hypothetical protein